MSELTAYMNPIRIHEGGTKLNPGLFEHTRPVRQSKTEMGPGADYEIKIRGQGQSGGHGLYAFLWSTWPLEDCHGKVL